MDDQGEGEPFGHGVASFEPTTTAVLLWTRLDHGGHEVDWVVARDPALRAVVATGTATTGPDRDHTVTVDVDGLEPGTTYWYRFTSDAGPSPVGRTRTLPGDGADRFLIATVSCARYCQAPLGVYRAVADREVDLVLHLGDYIYEDEGPSGPRRHDPPHTATTLDDYRRRLAQVRADPDTRALHLRHPVVTIWDDHDLSDNAWSDGAKAHDPEEHGPWPARVAAAARARQEWLPARLQDPDEPTTTWRSMVVGDLAEILLLDTRIAGRHQHAGDAGTLARDDPRRSLLGGEQRAWVQARLRDVDRPWAIVASSVVVNEIALPWPRWLTHPNALLPNGYAVLDGRLLHDDQWDGYPAERTTLVGALADRALAGGRSVILSGDVHSSWAFRGPCDPSTGEPVTVEATTPAVSSAAMGRAQYPLLWRVLDRAIRQLDHVVWADVTRRGYGVLDVTRDAVTARWWFVHPYADDPGAPPEPSAALRSERAGWPPRFERVDEPVDEPRRPGLPEPLPDRPADLPRLRRRHRLRLAAVTGAWAAGVAGVGVAVGSAVRRIGRGPDARG